MTLDRFRRPFGAVLPYPTLCGHEVNDMGECDDPDCENRWQMCTRCTAEQAAKDAFVERST
jgi:hypothetical protein